MACSRIKGIIVENGGDTIVFDKALKSVYSMTRSAQYTDTIERVCAG